MKSPTIVAGILLLGLAFVAAARADIPRPFPENLTPLVRHKYFHPPNTVSVVLEADDKATAPRLIVPKDLARRAKSAVKQESAQRKGAALPLPVNVALTLSFAGAGLCLLCGRAAPRTLLLLVALAGAGGAAVWAYPPVPFEFPKKPLPNGLPLDGVAIEIVEQGNCIRLILPRRMVADLAKELNAVVIPQNPVPPHQ